MNGVQKVLTIFIVTICVVIAMPQHVSMATNEGSGGIPARSTSTSASAVVTSVEDKIKMDDEAAGSLQSIIGNLLGFLQVASGLIAILMIAITGFNYIVATPQVKEELQKKMLPIIVGLVLVFGAVSIAKFILGAVGGG